MAFVVGNQSIVLFNEFDLSAYFDKMDPNREGEALESSTFGNTFKTYLPGMIKADVEVQGFADPAAGAVNEALEGSINEGSKALTLALSRAEGDQCHIAEVLHTKFTQTSSISGLVRCSGFFQANGDLKLGVLLHEPSAETANSGSGSAIDGGAPTTTGGVAHVHLSDHTGTGNVDIIIEDSANGTSGWATIGTFTTLTDVGSQRITIAGTIRQYTRATWTKVAGVTSITFTVALARL